MIKIQQELLSELNFLLYLFIFALLHSFFAIPEVRKRIMYALGLSQSIYRLAYNLISIALFGVVISGDADSAIIYEVTGFSSHLLRFIQASLLAAAFYCLKTTGLPAFIGIDAFFKDDQSQSISKEFVSTGCYSVVRHPLYLYSIMIILINPLVSFRWLIFTLFAIMYFIIGALLEERRMIRDFGEGYLDYQKRVPFILPNVISPKKL